MKPMRGDNIPQTELRRLFTYHLDGYLVWNSRPRSDFWSDLSFVGWNRRWAGKRAGCNSNGYTLISVNKVQCGAHRLVWIYHYGHPPQQIDHINHDRSDNRVENLRSVNNQENNKNCPIRSTNTSGVTGVSWNAQRNKWQAFITVDGRAKSLGKYTNMSDAVAARLAAAQKYGYHENHGAPV
jgi:hypothetical protein